MFALSENESEFFPFIFWLFYKALPEKDLVGYKRALFSPRIELYETNYFFGDTAAALDAVASPVLPILWLSSLKF